MEKNDFFAVIPARKGSKGIIGKNMKLIGGKPLVQFTMEAARDAVEINSSIVSTDDPEIIRLAKNIGIDVPFSRPEEFSTDTAKMSDVLRHALEWYYATNGIYPNNIVLLQPTSPFRNFKDIDRAVQLFSSSKKKCLVSVCDPMQHPNDFLMRNEGGGYSRINIGLSDGECAGRQSYSEVVFIDGGIYISEVMAFIKTGELIGDDPEVIRLDQSHSIDIDTPFDLELARCVYQSEMIV